MWRRKVIVSAAVSGLLILLVGWYLSLKREKQYFLSVTSSALFMGNIFWGRWINQWSQGSGLRYSYPFSRLNEFGREKYDAWIAGLECPMVSGVELTPEEEEATVSFNCSPKYLSEASKWFTVLSLSNNHTGDQGTEGSEETQRHLEDEKIQYFGHYDPRVHEDICNVIAIPAVAIKNDDEKEKVALPMALCGYNGFAMAPTLESLAIIRRYAQYMPVIAMPHMGREYQPAPDGLQIEIYRAMVDNGADVVLGDHPHWIQNTEAYKGHLIVYSMGNFIFDQRRDIEVIRSAAISIVFEVERADPEQLNKWIALGKACTTYHNECLARIEEEGLKKLPYIYKFGVVGADGSNRITKPASKEMETKILERLNWAQTARALKEPYRAMEK